LKNKERFFQHQQLWNQTDRWQLKYLGKKIIINT